MMEQKEEGDLIVLLWQNDNTVVIGRYQNPIEEVDTIYARKHNIRIVRRNSGGGAVYHDMGNLNYSFIVDEEDESMLQYCKDVLGAVLSLLGLNWKLNIRNDIIVNGKKISGTARYLSGKRMLYHGTLLINSNLDTLNKVLTRNTKILDSKTTKSVQGRVINIQDLITNNVLVKDVQNKLKEKFCENISYTEGNIYAVDKGEIRRLAEKKYQNREWNYGFMPKFNYRKQFTFPSGTICLNAQIENARIHSIKFTGDFFASGDVEMFENALDNMNDSEELLHFIQMNGGDDLFYGVTSIDINRMIEEVKQLVIRNHLL